MKCSSEYPVNAVLDDKSTYCIPFILAHLDAHRNTDRPFFIGLNGVQGAGKTTLASILEKRIEEEGWETVVCSIDDFYLPHEDQVALSEAHSDNALLQHRGQPGTHDLTLAGDFFASLIKREALLVPAYDKSLFSGAGDRTPCSTWRAINRGDQRKIQVVIFEGWCVGFRALSLAQLEQKYNDALLQPISKLPKHKLEDLKLINNKLKGYDVMTDTFDAFIHIDALEITFVYEWRLEQEAELRRKRGVGMSDEQVINFVNGYCPAYELFTEDVRNGVLRHSSPGAQLRLVVGRDRKVVAVQHT